MRKKNILCLLVVFLAVCCFSKAYPQSIDKVDAREAWSYHSDMAKYTGAYEWWYIHAHLDNGYLVVIAFSVPNELSVSYNKYLTDVSKGLPVLPYNPKDFATVDFSVTDEKGKTIFAGHEDVDPNKMLLPTTIKRNMVSTN